MARAGWTRAARTGRPRVASRASGRRLRGVKVPEGMRVLLQGKADFLREIAMELTKADIKVVTGPLPGGWEARAWLAVASGEAERALAIHQRYLDRMVEREGLPLRRDAADFDAEETTCPACMTPFKTAGVDRCPECGLKFG